ncbi:MAG: dihydrodipicolinate synthase family protein [[Clostridium] symbiosum]
MDEAAGRLTVIAHVACNNTRDNRILAPCPVPGCGRDCSHTAIYFKLPEYSAAGYWNDISEAAPDTDFIIYNIPQLAVQLL